MLALLLLLLPSEAVLKSSLHLLLCYRGCASVPLNWFQKSPSRSQSDVRKSQKWEVHRSAPGGGRVGWGHLSAQWHSASVRSVRLVSPCADTHELPGLPGPQGKCAAPGVRRQGNSLRATKINAFYAFKKIFKKLPCFGHICGGTAQLES